MVKTRFTYQYFCLSKFVANSKRSDFIFAYLVSSSVPFPSDTTSRRLFNLVVNSVLSTQWLLDRNIFIYIYWYIPIRHSESLNIIRYVGGFQLFTLTWTFWNLRSLYGSCFCFADHWKRTDDLFLNKEALLLYFVSMNSFSRSKKGLLQ